MALGRVAAALESRLDEPARVPLTATEAMKVG
jgi:hypothetical protein